jgi:very-short-patch-repair endonuclease
MPAKPETTADESRVLCLTDTEPCRHPDEALADLADRQYGVVARRQLGALGMSETMVTARVRRGLLRRMHRGVYAVGHRRLRIEGRWVAAVLAAGPGAVLSHRDAAALHGLRHRHDGRTDVTTTARGASSRARIRIHRTTVLAQEDVTVVDGIPVTSVARTLVDLAGVVQPHQLAKALNEAERIHQVDVTAIARALERTRQRRGSGHAAMRAALASLAAKGVQLTRSELEDRFAALLDAHRLPHPLHNVLVHGFEVDAYWPAARLVVELDGHAFHHTRAAIQRDRDEDNELELAGYRVLRFTHDDVARRPARTAGRVRRALARAGVAAPQPPAGGMSR